MSTVASSSPMDSEETMVHHLDMLLPLIQHMLGQPHLPPTLGYSIQSTEPALKLLRHLLVHKIESKVHEDLHNHKKPETVCSDETGHSYHSKTDDSVPEVTDTDMHLPGETFEMSSRISSDESNTMDVETPAPAPHHPPGRHTRFSVCSRSDASKTRLKLSCLHPHVLMGDSPDIGSRHHVADKDCMEMYIVKRAQSHAALHFHETGHCCYIHPERAFRLTWDLCSMALILVLMLVIPFELCFMWDTVEEDPVIAMINISSDVFFGIDIVLNCFTGFHKGKGVSSRLVTKPQEIIKNYARGWLWADLIATFPFARIANLSSGGLPGGSAPGGSGGGVNSPPLGMLRALKVAKIARMLKVIRVLKLGGLMQVVEEQVVTLQSMTVAFQLMKLTVIMLLISHCAACAWFAVGYWGQDHFSTTWLAAKDLTDSARLEQYIASVYFAITTGTTVGYGDISATNTMEQIVGSLLLVGAVAYIGHFLARVGQVVSSLKQSEAEMVKAKRDAMLFMRKRHVPQDLYHKVLRYIEHTYETESVTSLDNCVLEKLSESLQMQLALAVTGSVLKKTPLFMNIDDSFITAICRVCITRRAAAGDVVAREEQSAEGMFLIVRGEAIVFQDSIQISVLRCEDWFGERALFVSDSVHHVTIRCETDCEFLVLLREDFKQQLGQFPRVRREYNRLVAKCKSSVHQDQEPKTIFHKRTLSSVHLEQHPMIS